MSDIDYFFKFCFYFLYEVNFSASLKHTGCVWIFLTTLLNIRIDLHKLRFGQGLNTYTAFFSFVR